MKKDFVLVDALDELLPNLEHIAQGLATNGFAVVDDLLPEAIFNKIRKRFIKLKTQGEFEKSGIGKNVAYQVDAEIRGDFIRWIDTAQLHPQIEPFYKWLETLVPYLNRHLFAGIKDYESHYAFYPNGKGYAKHRDRFRSNPHRVLSVVFYLNENWKITDGGELVLYHNNLNPITTLAPIGNRLVVFKSEMIHEVLPCMAARYSITSWLLDKEIELTFL